MSRGIGQFGVLANACALLATLILFSNIRHLNAARAEDTLRQHQAVRDGLFKTLSASVTNYTFKYVVIELPAGTLPGRNYTIPVSHIRYDSTVLFAFDKFTLQPSAEPILMDFAQVILKDTSLRSLLIVGHTDSTGPDDYNVNLSKKRAFTVAQALQAGGINGSLIGIIAMGKEQPFATNSTTEGRSLNRRVEFFISDIPEAPEKAVEQIRFNPCFRNDQTSSANPTAGCDNTPRRIPIYSMDSKVRREIDLAAKPIERPRLPTGSLERPSIKGLENTAPNN